MLKTGLLVISLASAVTSFAAPAPATRPDEIPLEMLGEIREIRDVKPVLPGQVSKVIAKDIQVLVELESRYSSVDTLAAPVRRTQAQSYQAPYRPQSTQKKN